jgi:hypothetical protein
MEPSKQLLILLSVLPAGELALHSAGACWSTQHFVHIMPVVLPCTAQ